MGNMRELEASWSRRRRRVLKGVGVLMKEKRRCSCSEGRKEERAGLSRMLPSAVLFR